MRPAATFGRAVLIRPLALGAIAALLLGSVPASAAGGGVKTSQAAMLTPVGDGVKVTALITVGEPAGDDGYIFESIPDGIAISTRGKGTVEVYVNHETSRVPFPYPLPPGTPTAANAQNDFDNAQLSRLILNQKSAGVQTGKLVITSAQNYQRFCSNYLATAAEGFRSRAPVHERGDTGLGQSEREGMAGNGRCRDRARRRRGRGLRPQDRQEPADLGHGPPQPRERRADPWVRRPGAAVR